MDNATKYKNVLRNIDYISEISSVFKRIYTLSIHFYLANLYYYTFTILKNDVLFQLISERIRKRKAIKQKNNVIKKCRPVCDHVEYDCINISSKKINIQQYHIKVSESASQMSILRLVNQLNALKHSIINLLQLRYYLQLKYDHFEVYYKQPNIAKWLTDFKVKVQCKKCSQLVYRCVDNLMLFHANQIYKNKNKKT